MNWSQGSKHSQNTKITLNVTQNAWDKAKGYQVLKKFKKQLRFLESNPRHNSLNYKSVPEFGKGVWRFRVNDHYWGLTTKQPNQLNTIRVFDVVTHP